MHHSTGFPRIWASSRPASPGYCFNAHAPLCEARWNDWHVGFLAWFLMKGFDQHNPQRVQLQGKHGEDAKLHHEVSRLAESRQDDLRSPETGQKTPIRRRRVTARSRGPSPERRGWRCLRDVRENSVGAALREVGPEYRRVWLTIVLQRSFYWSLRAEDMCRRCSIGD